MCNYVFKVLGSNNYQFRRKIPQDLIPHCGKKEIKKSLRTSDRREAEKLSRLEASRLDSEWESIRQSLLPTDNSKPVVDRVISSGSQDSESTRAKYIGDDIWNSEAKQVTAAVTASLPAYDLQDVETTSYRFLLHARALSSLAVKHGLLEEYRTYVGLNLAGREEMLKTGSVYPFGDEICESPQVTEAMRNGFQAFLNGTGPTVWLNPSQLRTNSSNQLATNKEAAVSMIALVEKWEGEGKRNQKTVDMYNRTVTRFRNMVGTMAVAGIKREHVIRFKEKLLEIKQSPASIKRQLVVVTGLLNFAKAYGWISENPAIGVSMPVVKKEKSRVSFSTSALNAIFSSPVYQQRLRPKGGAGEAAYWLPVLALYTGARIEELGQLHPSDVEQEVYFDENNLEAHAWVIKIKNSEELGQGVKNFGSNRRVPVHPDLEHLGFIRYVLQAQSESRYRIFHELKADKYGTETAQFSKWFNRYLRLTCEVTDKRMVFHSFRHSFKDLCRANRISEHDRLTGHVSGTVGDSYGSDFYPLGPLVEAIKHYKVLGLDKTLLKPVA